MKKKYGTSLIIGNGFDLNLGMVRVLIATNCEIRLSA